MRPPFQSTAGEQGNQEHARPYVRLEQALTVLGWSSPDAMVRRTDDTLRCSFCGKSQNEVKKLIAGPTVYICNECIDICNEIITDDQQQETAARRPPLPKPIEIKEFLDDYVIGQEETKKRLAVAVYQHYKRVDMLK